MTAHTQTGHFNVSPEKLYNFISDIENMPKWATNYVKSIRKEGDDYIVETPEGDMYQEFDVDEKNYVINVFCGPTKDKMWMWPARVASDNMGGSVLTFTCIQMPEQDNEQFMMQCRALAEEFENLQEIAKSL